MNLFLKKEKKKYLLFLKTVVGAGQVALASGLKHRAPAGGQRERGEGSLRRVYYFSMRSTVHTTTITFFSKAFFSSLFLSVSLFSSSSSSSSSCVFKSKIPTSKRKTHFSRSPSSARFTRVYFPLSVRSSRFPSSSSSKTIKITPRIMYTPNSARSSSSSSSVVCFVCV